MEIIDSEDEAEKHSNEGSDIIIVSRPNPLEPRPKPKKKQENKDSKGHPVKPTVDELFKQQKHKNREIVPELKLFGKR